MEDSAGAEPLPRSQPGGFAPDPGAAPALRRIAAQTLVELRTTLGNGEQLLLQLAFPVLLLIFLTAVPVLDLGPGPRVAFLAPGVIALGVMSSAFTGQAIATGFERRYGVLKRLGATPLGRPGLLLAKTATVILTEVLQVVVLGAIAVAMGWRPHGAPAVAVLLVLIGTAGFSGLGLLLAGTLRAEATLAAANLIYLVLLGLGGVFYPLTLLPGWLAAVSSALPITALSQGLRDTLEGGAALPIHSLIVLLVWTVLGLGAASLTFRWE
ncbi:MAG TPA: ABC transporter permease [Candidatus Dormibacteraeota bacterium]|nr:ABC transporter permease [Candidatus Dormibacteraeota bacterium]